MDEWRSRLCVVGAVGPGDGRGLGTAPSVLQPTLPPAREQAGGGNEMCLSKRVLSRDVAKLRTSGGVLFIVRSRISNQSWGIWLQTRVMLASWHSFSRGDVSGESGIVTPRNCRGAEPGPRASRGDRLPSLALLVGFSLLPRKPSLS